MLRPSFSSEHRTVPKALLNPNYFDKNILLLQGPVGPFFRNLAKDLEANGNRVFKINFNAGDALFYPIADHYRDKLENFADYLQQYLEQHQIDSVVLFGDCRPIHLTALEVIRPLKLDIFVFEEGYIRPNHITLEQVGVNGNSLLPKNAEYYLEQPLIPKQHVIPIGSTFWHTVGWVVLYYLAATLFSFLFPHYQHHRPLHIGEGLYWIRGTWRKWWYKYQERGIEKRLVLQLSRQYFLVPLQLPGDAQVKYHSSFNSIEHFIQTVITSFARYAPKDTHLIIKQHPLDRGYNNYAPTIQRLAQSFSITDRVRYIHDQNLPRLLRNTRGVVVINSTVGLSALYHHAPTKVCGEAVYDIPQMCYQGSLDQFWQATQAFKVNQALCKQYLHYLEHRCQINGSFYRKIAGSTSQTGLNLAEDVAASEVSP